MYVCMEEPHELQIVLIDSIEGIALIISSVCLVSNLCICMYVCMYVCMYGEAFNYVSSTASMTNGLGNSADNVTSILRTNPSEPSMY